MGFCNIIDMGHVIKTIFLGLGTNAFDVFTDVGNGLYHYHPKNVTRNLGNSTAVVPDNCVPHVDINAIGMFDCLEEDTTWAIITFSCIQLPAVVLAICAVFAALVFGCKSGFETDQKKVILGSLLILLVPFPATVFIQQVTSLFVVNARMELMSAIFLFGEGSLEASPQLLLLLYTIFSDSEREVATIQMASIVSSIMTISKTSIELYLNESYNTGIFPSDVWDHTGANDDSMMKERSLLQKLKLMAEFSPAFLTSLIFKVGSIAIICTFLKEYSAIYLGIGICITFIVASDFRFSTDERTGIGLFYCLTNVTILAKCPLGSRNQNFPQMTAVSITWLILHTLTLIVLMIWFGAMELSTHLPHWSDHRFAFHENLTLFYATTCVVLFFGPISILALWGLKAKNLGAAEARKMSMRQRGARTRLSSWARTRRSSRHGGQAKEKEREEESRLRITGNPDY